MPNNLKQSSDGEHPWMGKVQRDIAYGQKGRGLRPLEKIIEYDMPLFYGLSDVQEDRRLALVYLRHHGQMGNSDYRRMNRIDALTAGQELRGLVQTGLVEQRGAGRWTSYALKARETTPGATGEVAREDGTKSAPS